MRLYYEMLPDNLVQVLQELMKIELLNRYRLVGGTSLALQLGHRSSVDIDLFGAGGTPPTSDIAQELTSVFQDAIRIIRVQPQGITATIRGIKVDVYDWKVPFLYEAVSVDGLRLATIDDIFAFKCEAILDRKAEKDFADLAEIAQAKPLKELPDVFRKSIFKR